MTEHYDDRRESGATGALSILEKDNLVWERLKDPEAFERHELELQKRIDEGVANIPRIRDILAAKASLNQTHTSQD